MAEINEINDGHVLGIFRSSIGFTSVADQKLEIDNFANSKNLLVRDFFDLKSNDHEDVGRFASAIIQRGAHTIVLWRIDCLPRHLADMESIVLLFQELISANIKIMSVVDGIDSSLTADVFISKLGFAWLAAKQNRKRENARASIQKARSKNHCFGRRKVRNDLQIRQLRSNGLSIRAIAKEVGVSTTAVQRALVSST
jgi:DNA invertase Pin-like site-specific DNA recombinase